MRGGGRYAGRMDEQVTLRELTRLEAARKLETLPEGVLEVAWVREAQVEAVIDAIVAVAYRGDVGAISHARHVGEWCARIAVALDEGPDPSFARRVGVLCDVDPDALDQIAEVRHLSDSVRAYQDDAMMSGPNSNLFSIIVSVANEFDERISPGPSGHTRSATLVLQSMKASSHGARAQVVEALDRASTRGRQARVA